MRYIVLEYIEKFDRLFVLLDSLQKCPKLSDRLLKKNFSQEIVTMFLRWVEIGTIETSEM